MRGNRKSKLFDADCCLVCGNPNVQYHHIFYGTSNRKISDRYGYIAPLCLNHHTGQSGVHFNKELDMQLKQYAQRHYLENHGDINDFIKDFGKSYL